MQVQFRKIYSGKIITDDQEIPFIEYKIISPIDQKYVFKKGQFHCAWFILQENKQIHEKMCVPHQQDDLCIGRNLLGPVSIDTELIKTNKRVILDEEYPNLNGMEIVDLVKHNDPILIINSSMFMYLSNCVEMVV